MHTSANFKSRAPEYRSPSEHLINSYDESWKGQAYDHGAIRYKNEQTFYSHSLETLRLP